MLECGLKAVEELLIETAKAAGDPNLLGRERLSFYGMHGPCSQPRDEINPRCARDLFSKKHMSLPCQSACVL